MTNIPTIGDKRWELVQKWATSQESIRSDGLFTPEALDFFDRAGITDPTVKSKENALILGLQANNLWAPLTFCLIGRSAYNAGTGTVVHDLKDAAMNGTFVNSPTWGADGIVFNATNKAVTTGRTQTMNGSWSVFSVMKEPSASGSNRRVLGSSGAAGPGLLFTASATVSATPIGTYDGAIAPTAGSINVTAFSMIGDTYSVANKQKFYQGASSIGTAAVANVSASHTVQLSSSSGDGLSDGTIAVALLFGSTELTPAQEATLYNLLKTTICSDLSLP